MPVRLSEFWTLMERAFGKGYAAIVADSHVLGELDNRTASAAIEGGEPVRRVWEAVVLELDVPSDQQHLPDPPKRR